MSKKTWNPIAQQTVDQINSTLNMLCEKSLAISCNYVAEVDIRNHHCRITWNNHVSGRANSGNSFTKLNQYVHILSNNSYHCLLFDGSLIRANFEFEDNILLIQNLLWWPAPYDYEYGSFLKDGYAPVDLVEEFFEENHWYEHVKMRSPIRIDFDSNNNSVKHPQSHMHIQHEDARLNTDTPICFNRFVDFIFRNFYPQCTINFSKFDFIEYKIPPFQKIDYVSSRLIV